MFLDSDDWINPETLYKMVPLMVNTDLVGWNHYYNEDKKQWKRHVINNSPVVYELYNMSNLLLDMITPEFDVRYNGVYLGAVRGVWGKLYKREYIERFKIRFEENLKIGEDACFNVDYIRNIKKASFYNFYLNHYRVDNGSANRRRRDDIVEIRINLLREYLSRFPIGEDINANTCYVREVLSCVMNCIKKMEFGGSNIRFKEFIQNIFEYDSIALANSLKVDNGFYSVQERIIKELITKKSTETMTLIGCILRHGS
ncbi:MAG: glycosyltransferase [Lachnospiraceae bacterium]|nr:glycosyltransferase [Lachnospiraceae bacterium]